ncbi:hypothetical protein [Vreelandella azerica]|nr:hypothetical protein [Halomonas azerica]
MKPIMLGVIHTRHARVAGHCVYRAALPIVYSALAGSLPINISTV